MAENLPDDRAGVHRPVLVHLLRLQGAGGQRRDGTADGKEVLHHPKAGLSDPVRQQILVHHADGQHFLYRHDQSLRDEPVLCQVRDPKRGQKPLYDDVLHLCGHHRPPADHPRGETHRQAERGAVRRRRYGAFGTGDPDAHGGDLPDGHVPGTDPAGNGCGLSPPPSSA